MRFVQFLSAEVSNTHNTPQVNSQTVWVYINTDDVDQGLKKFCSDGYMIYILHNIQDKVWQKEAQSDATNHTVAK